MDFLKTKMLNEDDSLPLKAKGIMLKQSDSTFDQSKFILIFIYKYIEI
jgi:hypothetical protein